MHLNEKSKLIIDEVFFPSRNSRIAVGAFRLLTCIKT